MDDAQGVRPRTRRRACRGGSPVRAGAVGTRGRGRAPRQGDEENDGKCMENGMKMAWNGSFSCPFLCRSSIGIEVFLIINGLDGGHQVYAPLIGAEKVISGHLIALKMIPILWLDCPGGAMVLL